MLKKQLKERSGAKCEMCGNTEDLHIYTVAPQTAETINNSILACGTCIAQIDEKEETQANHWRCLNESMWSEVPAVQVVSYRMLHRLKSEGWTQDLLDMMYMEAETEKWAKQGLPDENAVVHKDAFGAVLQAGDTVVLTQSLNVKGSSAQAKRGTAVRRISLVPNNPEQIEGRVDGQMIVILTKYVKKSN